MNNLNTKYEVPGLKCSSGIERKPFFNSRSSWPYCDFDLLTSKSIGIIYLSWQTCIPRLKFTGLSDLQLLGRNHFSAQGQRDLDLYYIDLKIKRDHLLVMTNLHAEIEVPGPKHSSVIKRKPFFSSRSQWPWPSTHWPQSWFGSSTCQDQPAY